MKKIGLLSVFDVKNYGSMLQTYAMQKSLEILGCENEIVKYNRKSLMIQLSRLFDLTLLKSKLKFVHRDIYGKYINKDLGRYFQGRDHVFDGFVENHLKLSPEIPTKHELIGKMSDYELVLVGSDQVWNPVNLKKDYYTMNFVPEEITKVAYASSFGVSEIPEGQKKDTSKYLLRIDHIGVREDTGKAIIKRLINREVPVVADPTLLLPKKYWDELVENQEPIVDGRYIVCYFLGENSQHREYVNNLKEIAGCKIVAIPHCDGIVKADLAFGDEIPSNIGPIEFLNLIKHAEFVCTDSFHCTVFAMLNHKNFFTFERFKQRVRTTASTNSRIHSLLKIAKLEDRLINEESLPTNRLLEPINFKTCDKNIDLLRKQSIDYLRKALSMEKNNTSLLNFL
ncbi:MAG: polysaccharide pyruvyl transferase family protein [Carboxylicivirga sp.]|jgi:hypothetical protein|nr:polysaccharide pyruvyl transferase family protein [Carboxylicivirga sp.]